MSKFIESSELWSGVDVPIIGGTGEKGVGKTLFGLTIDPYSPDGSAKPIGKTLVYDFEGSSVTHRRLIQPGCYFDCAKELMRTKGKGYTPKDRFEWFRNSVFEQIKEGGVSVVMIDPISELEEGLAMWVEANPRATGYTPQQFKKSTALLMGAVKAYQKSMLDNIRTFVGTLYFVAHQRLQFKGGTPTGKREAKGKETLFELASLYLKFDRNPYKDDKGETVVPTCPFATVMKTRLNHSTFADGVIVPIPILPPRIPNCTPQAIRNYIAKPADFRHLKKEEMVVEEHLSDDDKLLLQAAVAETERATAEAKLSLELERSSRIMAKTETHSSPVSPDMTYSMNEEIEKVEPPTIIQKQKVDDLQQYFGEEFKVIAKEMGVTKSSNSVQYQALIDRLQQMRIDRMRKSLDDMPHTEGREMAAPDSKPTDRQKAELKELSEHHGKDVVRAVANRLGVPQSGTFAQYQLLIDELCKGYKMTQWGESAKKLLDTVDEDLMHDIIHRMESQLNAVDAIQITNSHELSVLEEIVSSRKKLYEEFKNTAEKLDFDHESWVTQTHDLPCVMCLEDSVFQSIFNQMKESLDKGTPYEPTPF